MKKIVFESESPDSKKLARMLQCAVKGVFSQWVKFPPGTYRSSR